MRYIILFIFTISFYSAEAQIQGTQYKDALISKKADLHYLYSYSPGFSSINNGRMVGICVDIMSDFEFFLLDKYDITVNRIENTEDYENLAEFFMRIDSSQFGVFGLSSITLNDERLRKYNFSPPIIENYAVMLSNDNIPDLSSLDSISKEFKNLTALTVRNSSNQDQLLDIKTNYFHEMEIEYVNNFDTLMQILSIDEKYFAIVDMIYMIEAKKKDLPVKEHHAGIQEADEFAIILPSQTDWNIPLRKFLTSEYKNSLSYRKIITRHLGWEALIWLDGIELMNKMKASN